MLGQSQSTQRSLRGIQIIAGVIFAVLLMAAIGIGVSNLTTSWGQTANMPEPTPPGNLKSTQTTYKTIKDIPNSRSLLSGKQLEDYNLLARRYIDEVQIVNQEVGGGSTAEQLRLVAQLEDEMANGFMSARQIATELQAIYPKADVVYAFRQLPQDIIMMFESPPPVLYTVPDG
jgi:hypothetical protein